MAFQQWSFQEAQVGEVVETQPSGRQEIRAGAAADRDSLLSTPLFLYLRHDGIKATDHFGNDMVRVKGESMSSV